MKVIEGAIDLSRWVLDRPSEAFWSVVCLLTVSYVIAAFGYAIWMAYRERTAAQQGAQFESDLAASTRKPRAPGFNAKRVG